MDQNGNQGQGPGAPPPGARPMKKADPIQVQDTSVEEVGTGQPDYPAQGIPQAQQSAGQVPQQPKGVPQQPQQPPVDDEWTPDAVGGVRTSLEGIDWSPPPPEKLALWKRPPPNPGEQFDPARHGFGDDKIREVLFPNGMRFTYRILTRAEYKAIIYGPFTIEERENEMCNRCVLWPEGIDFNQAFLREMYGLPSMIVEYIMDQSGFLPALEVKKV